MSHPRGRAYHARSGIARLREIEKRLTNTSQHVPPSALMGKAVEYALSQWEKPLMYIDKAFLTPDANLIETATTNGLEPYRYLRCIFEKYPHVSTGDRFQDLPSQNTPENRRPS